MKSKCKEDPGYLLDESRHKICLRHGGEMEGRQSVSGRGARPDATSKGDTCSEIKVHGGQDQSDLISHTTCPVHSN
jgi:hypothetical protein